MNKTRNVRIPDYEMEGYAQALSNCVETQKTLADTLMRIVNAHVAMLSREERLRISKALANAQLDLDRVFVYIDRYSE